MYLYEMTWHCYTIMHHLALSSVLFTRGISHDSWMKHLFLLTGSYCICMRRFCTTEFLENITLCTVAFRFQSHTIVHLHVHLHVHCTCTVAEVCTCTYTCSIPFSGCGHDFSFMVCSNHNTVHCIYTMFSFIQFPSLFISFSILHFLSLLLLILLFSVPFILSSSFTFPCVRLCPSLLFSVLPQRFMI